MEDEEKKELVDEEKDFDFNVCFPSLGHSGKWSSDGKGLERKELVVFLFGWAGCKDRYLAKYSGMYQELGCISVRYIIPVQLVFFKRQAVSAIGEKLYDLFEELELKGHPVVLHIFSGAGIITYNAFNAALKGKSDENEIRSSIKGAVFDSCPALSSNWQRCMVFVGLIFPQLRGFRETLMRCLCWVGFGLYDIFRVGWSLLGGPKHQHWYRELQQDSNLPMDQLYLYSQADTVCSSESIEHFIAHQSLRGANVDSYCWQDSLHCAHFRAYPQEYTRHVSKFLTRLRESGN